ncbi:MAG TPA: LytTR family DNA-binding domain-containing protein [Sphingomonas sp.]|uniref:LytTR family DNA-binding domain-containing protein n=1 Tax=Sphingomonas sp. TaxID=28214 RepID=UPI002CD4F866|nr:LytTR family DNA-binding domain-containing protein [Sphingomonas sp.]HMI20833.1 LytTR family DNA-binding domain-containing protein [Sphingomonas sp.]
MPAGPMRAFLAWPFGRALPRKLAPLLLVPLGALYCQAYELFFDAARGSAWGSFVWAAATLGSWVVAAMLFERLARPGDTRARLMRRAILLGVPAYAVSATAALALGADNDHAFFSRVPLLAVALLAATLYRAPEAGDAGPGAAAQDDRPPIAPTEIAFASAAGNYVELHAHGRSTIWRQTMHNAERILASAGFVRVHRSYLVPRRGIETVMRGRTRPIEVALYDGRRLPVSNRYAANLRD